MYRVMGATHSNMVWHRRLIPSPICLFGCERLSVSVEWIAVKECGTWGWADLTALGSVRFGPAVRSQIGFVGVDLVKIEIRYLLCGDMIGIYQSSITYHLVREHMRDDSDVVAA